MIEILFFEKTITSVFVILISIIVYLIIKNIIEKAFEKNSKLADKKKSLTITNLIVNIIKYLLIIIVILTILNIWGIDTKALLASLGIIGVVAGLAIQDMLKDFLAGFSIVFNNEYSIGDNIQIGTFRGTVVEVGMKTTKIRSYSGEVKSISNRNITEVINYSIKNTRKVIDIEFDNKEKTEKIENFLKELCEQLNKEINYLTSNVKILGIEKLTDEIVTYRLVANLKPHMDFNFKRELLKTIKLTFEKGNLEICFPKAVIDSEL